MSYVPTLGRRQFLACVLGAATKAPFARAASAVVAQPFVQNIRENSATLQWATDASEDATVEIEGPDGFSWTARIKPSEFATGNSETAQHYSARVEGLRPGTEYQYRIRGNGRDLASGAEFGFRTSELQRPFRFLALGDSGWGSIAQRELAELMRKDRPSLVVHVGDLAYPSATFKNLKTKYLDVYQAQMRRVPFFPVLGNHDYWDGADVVCKRLHDLPKAVPPGEQGLYYSFDWGDVHFIALDSNRPLELAVQGESSMLQWLEADLAATNKFWRVAYFHHPPYAAGPNWSDPLTRLAEAHIAPILEKYNVPLVLNGHEHSYQRTYPMRGGSVAPRGTIYVTTGGGGADLYSTEARPWIASRLTEYHYLRVDVDARKMNLTAIDRLGRAFDSAEVSAAPGITGDVVSGAGTADIGAGGLISVYGWQLAMRESTAGGDVLSASASDVRVTLGDRDLPLIYASPRQVNALLPPDATGMHTLRVSTPGGSVNRDIEIRPVAPALFPGGVFDNSRQITEESPCKPGSRISAFLTGAMRAEGKMIVSLGGVQLDGSIEAFAPVRGVQRIEFEVPASIPSGVFPLAVQVSGVQSNFVPVAVAR